MVFKISSSPKKGGALFFLLVLFACSKAGAMQDGGTATLQKIKNVYDVNKDTVRITFNLVGNLPKIRILIGAGEFTAARDLGPGSDCIVECPRAKNIRCWAVIIEHNGEEGMVIGDGYINVGSSKEKLVMVQDQRFDGKKDLDRDSVEFV
jgi:hypothetical protein